MIKCPKVLRWGGGNDLSSVSTRLKCIHINILNEISHSKILIKSIRTTQFWILIIANTYCMSMMNQSLC